MWHPVYWNSLKKFLFIRVMFLTGPCLQRQSLHPPHSLSAQQIWNKMSSFLSLSERNFKWPSMQRGQCPIYNGTLETFACPKSRESSAKYMLDRSKIRCTLWTVSTQHSWSVASVPQKYRLFYVKSGVQTFKSKFLLWHPGPVKCLKGTVVNRDAPL